jgi:thiol-disulfide isomerase/thioredoxin
MLAFALAVTSVVHLATRLPTTQRVAHHPVCALGSISDEAAYHTLVEGTRSSSRVVVIEFSSERCQACQALRPKLETLSNAWLDVDFYEISFDHSSCRDVFKLFGVNRLPHIHVASHGQAVESFACPSNKIGVFTRKLESHGCRYRSSPVRLLRWLSRVPAALGRRVQVHAATAVKYRHASMGLR